VAAKLRHLCREPLRGEHGQRFAHRLDRHHRILGADPDFHRHLPLRNVQQAAILRTQGAGVRADGCEILRFQQAEQEHVPGTTRVAEEIHAPLIDRKFRERRRDDFLREVW